MAQYALSAFELSQIRLVQHRKQAPSLPTLMLEFKVDSPSERLRRRRSSRTGALGSKDPWANTVLFRDAPDERNTIHDWNSRIKPRLVPGPREPAGDDSATSPGAHSTTSFTNPFAQRDGRAASNASSRPEYQVGSSTPSVSAHPHPPRERPTALISPSPSLRSRRSDLSSQASSQHPPTGFAPLQNYTASVPSDLPSPASTSGYDAQFVEGWTSAQGRSSALSSHTRGSNSIASVVPPIGSTPPGPRETILDRAFQMRYIPGSDKLQGKDEEKISSIARFEALMREVDERKRQKALVQQENFNKSSFDLDEESGESGVESDEDEDGLNMPGPDVSMRSPAQRALDYISGRNTPLPSSRPLAPASKSPPIPFLNRSTTDSDASYRPQTGASPPRQPNSLATNPRSFSSTAIPGLQDWHSNSSGLGPDRDSQERRRSGASTKRLSFQEFAKRLSSTSSLLLVQTNASSSSGRDGSRRGSSEYGGEEARAHPVLSPFEREQREVRRTCRGSVGVFGGEGGFL
jgi:hypothetical protein